MQSDFRPNVIWVYTSQKSTVPLLQGRFQDGKNLIYVCREGVCNLPVDSAGKASELLDAQ
jgi:uncharacterized protein YyaL (SSP411 family)